METEWLTLRPLTAQDAPAFVELFGEPAVTRFAWGRPLAESEALELLAKFVAHWEQQGFGLWAVMERTSQAMVGVAGLSVPTFLPEVLPAVEAGWRFHPDSWGKGLASEAARAALDYGFGGLGLDKVVAITQPGNRRSWQLMERLGMQVGTRTQHPQHQAALVVYGITRQEWQMQAAPERHG